jgi:hypothetical protein
MYIRNYSSWRKVNEATSEVVNQIVSKLSEFGDLKKGQNNKGVILLQTALLDAGLLKSKGGPLKNGVDGDFGGNTEAALKSLIGKSEYLPATDSDALGSGMESTGKDFSNTISNWESFSAELERLKLGMKVPGTSIPAEIFGLQLGITDKSAADYSSRNKLDTLNLPKEGPIGDIVKSAWANLNVPTRGITDSQNGGVGCAAAVSIIFYRATGMSVMKGRQRSPIELGTGSFWDDMTKNKENWEKIDNWRTDWQPGDIILTSRGKESGHVGVVVENGMVISNASYGFAGDNRGQIELNYSIPGGNTGIKGEGLPTWDSIAKRNPEKTACFRYKGPILTAWGAAPTQSPTGMNDVEAISTEGVG